MCSMSEGPASASPTSVAPPDVPPEVAEGVEPPSSFAYDAAWALYALGWSVRPDRPLRLAIGSFLRDGANKVEIVQANEAGTALERRATFAHLYPPTKVLFLPDATASGPDLLATTGDCLRLWEVSSPTSHAVTLKTSLLNGKKAEVAAPMTSFDWNAEDPRLIATSCVDTTCSIWDITAEKVTMQLIAHDKAVFDLAFCRGTDIFGSVGADGSVRIFDLRSLDRSTIIYESADSQPTLRLSWNRLEPNYVAVVLADSGSVLVLDVRVPAVPVMLLHGHHRAANTVQWAPHVAGQLCSAGDDGQALVWDLAAVPRGTRPVAVQEPALAYAAEAEVNAMRWSATQPEWVALCHGRTLRLLRL
eukprot:EG_transcript_12326